MPEIVLSRTRQNTASGNFQYIGSNLSGETGKRKAGDGKNIIIFGSPFAIHSLLSEKLIDEFWLFINPVHPGEGLPLFEGITARETEVVDK